MNKLIIVVLAFAIVAPALADDLVYAPFRGAEGTTYSEWTYATSDGVFSYDIPDTSWFVSHPLKEDPWTDPCSPGTFSSQSWAGDDDPCAPDWMDEPFGPEGRQGMVNFRFGSWDIGNFIHDQPAKDVWIQITYLSSTGERQAPEWMDVGYMSEEGIGGWWEDAVSVWIAGGGNPDNLLETWLDDPCDPGSAFGYWEGDTADLDPGNEVPMYTWEGVEIGTEPVLERSQVLEAGPGDTAWIHDVYSATLGLNPEYEWFQMGMGPEYQGFPTILIDQIVIETLCYVPEPATMVLLGLGSLMMIRRKKR